MSNKIHPMAFVDPTAKLGDNVTIDAFVFIDKDVVIGDNCKIRPHASVLHNTVIGNNNEIFEGAVIGANPQDFRWKGQKSFLHIGDNNKIHEHVIINRSIYEGGITRIGNNSFIMAQTHIGHDSTIGDWCVLGNGVKIAGEVKIGNYDILSSGVIVHEGFHIGDWALIKGGTRVTNNVPPYVIMAHNPIIYAGVNAIIMRKGNMTEETIDNVARCYRHVYQSGTSMHNAVRRIREDAVQTPEANAIVEFITDHDYHLAGISSFVE